MKLNILSDNYLGNFVDELRSKVDDYWRVVCSDAKNFDNSEDINGFEDKMEESLCRILDSLKDRKYYLIQEILNKKDVQVN